MSADDQSEPVAVSSTDTRPGPADSAPALTNNVAEWLARRVATNAGETTVSVQVLPGRWMIRVESGGSASAIEQPSRGEHSASDVSALIRRWARSAGFTSRVESPHAGEARLALTPPIPQQS
jgi:hypothetical protein